MAKSDKTRIEFDYGGTHYKLEYTANALKKLERAGVKFSKIDEMIFSAPEVLFRGAFYANHPAVPEKTIRDIYKSLKRQSEDMPVEYDDDGHEIDALTLALADMVREAAEEITGRGEQGNVTWKVTR